jgi:ferredoxin
VALLITDDCVACGVCEPECPTNSISEGDDGEIYIINTSTCIECEGDYDEPRCAEICPIECCVRSEDLQSC